MMTLVPSLEIRMSARFRLGLAWLTAATTCAAISVAFFPALGAAETGVAVPTTLLKSGDLEIRVHTPDAQNGYYRGQRFDHSGFVAQATWRGHTFFGELREPRNPEAHDHVAGVAEEFGIDEALGYAEADPATGTFIKIGVGVLQRNGTEPYKFHKRYPLIEQPAWQIQATATEVTCSQTLTLGDWGYQLSKTIAVADDGNSFTVTRTLTNSGTKPITTNHYSHNNLCIDQDPINPAYRLIYPAPVTKVEGNGPIAITDNVLTLTEPLTKSLWVRLEGVPDNRNEVRVEHQTTGVAVTISHDYPAAKVILYGESRAICPEHFAAINVAPGGSMTWTTTYSFSHLD